jgi:hypothetical protein
MAEKPQAVPITRGSDTSATDEAGEIGPLYGQMCNKEVEVLIESCIAVLLSATRQQWKAVLYRIALNVTLFQIQIPVLTQDISAKRSRSYQPDEQGSISGRNKIFSSLLSQDWLCDPLTLR